MTVVFDTTTLSMVLIPGATAKSRKTKKPIKHAAERVNLFIEKIAANDGVIVIPSPVLSEIIVKIPEKADELLKRIKASPWFRVEGFDAAAAVELGLRTSRAMAAGDKREGLQRDWTKVKFDRQIVAIALVANAEVLISDDADVAAIGERWGMQVQSIEQLPIPAALIPPPLLAHLEDDNEAGQDKIQGSQPESATPDLRRSGEGHPEDQAGAKAADEKSES